MSIIKLIIGICVFAFGIFVFASGWQSFAPFEPNLFGQECYSKAGCFHPEWVGVGAGILAFSVALILAPLRLPKMPSWPQISWSDPKKKGLAWALALIGAMLVLFVGTTYGVKSEATLLGSRCAESDQVGVQITNNTIVAVKSVKVKIDIYNKEISHAIPVYSDNYVLHDVLVVLKIKNTCTDNYYIKKYISSELAKNEYTEGIVGIAARAIDEVDAKIKFMNSHSIITNVVSYSW